MARVVASEYGEGSARGEGCGGVRVRRGEREREVVASFESLHVHLFAREK